MTLSALASPSWAIFLSLIGLALVNAVSDIEKNDEQTISRAITTA